MLERDGDLHLERPVRACLGPRCGDCGGVLDGGLGELTCLARVGDGELAIGEETYMQSYDVQTGERNCRLASFLMPPGVMFVAPTVCRTQTVAGRRR